MISYIFAKWFGAITLFITYRIFASIGSEWKSQCTILNLQWNMMMIIVVTVAGMVVDMAAGTVAGHFLFLDDKIPNGTVSMEENHWF